MPQRLAILPSRHRLLVPAAAMLVSASSASGQLNVPFPAVFELSSLEASGGALGFVVPGLNQDDRCGNSVASAGDVDGDGTADIVVGARTADPNGINNAGEAYVILGSSSLAGGVLDVTALNGANGFVVTGVGVLGFAGSSVSSAGDVNADGFDDVLIDNAGGGVNQFYLVYGGGKPFTSPLDGSLLASPVGTVFSVSAESLSCAGDVNADGIDDFIAGDIGEEQSYVFFGNANGYSSPFEIQSIDGSNGFVLDGMGNFEFNGFSVSSAGDINADGIGDVVVGAPLADPSGVSNAGKSYVVFGGIGVGSTGVIELPSLNGMDGFVINGINANDQSGRSVSCAGDVNGDGNDDLIIGSVSAGQCYVVFGGPSVGSSGVIELSSLNGTNGFVMNRTSGRLAGSSAGDVNNDGVDDLVIGNELAAPNGNMVAGESYVVYGSSSIGTSGVLELSTLNGANGFVIAGIGEGDQSGRSVSSAGDVNADGINDIIIGAQGAGTAGEAYVIFGRDPDPCSAADVNSDGFTTPADFNAWVVAFNTQAAVCDQNGDGLCNPQDFSAFILNYNSGC